MQSTLLLLALAPLANALAQDASPRAGADAAPLLEARRLRQAMSRLASEHPKHVSLLNVGESRSGLKIEALRLAAGERVQGRPAMLVVANIDGPLVYTSDIALTAARRLAEGYGSDERITALLDSTTLYIVPRANPDAAEGYFATPRHERVASGHGIDNDRDGRAGEDGPDDLNRDGMITLMRVPDPEGRWTEDPADPRVLVEADPLEGQRGMWKLVAEGRDDDGDGQASEDPQLDALVNRNFAHDWPEHHAEGGLFPTDEPEVRGLCEFVLTHEDIQVVITYGALSNMVGKIKPVADDAPAKYRVPPSGVRASDASLYERLGETYREITSNKAASEGERAGSFQSWCYAHRGLFSIEIRPWAIPLDTQPAEAGDEAETESDAPERSDDAKRLLWMEANGETSRFLGWTPYEHPELGPVDIGGFAPFAMTDPPASARGAIADGEIAFLLEVAGRLARVALSDVRAKALGGGMLEVEATVVNEGYLPLTSKWGQSTRTQRPAHVELRLPSGAELLAGRPRILIDELAGSGGHSELRWLVRGARAGSIGVRVETDHAGAATATPEVQK